MAYSQRADGSIIDEQGFLVQGGYDVNKGIYPSTKNAQGEYLIGVEGGELKYGTIGGISLPDRSDLNLGEDLGVSDRVVGIASSLPSVNSAEIDKQTRDEFVGTRETLSKSFEQRIAEAEGLSKDEQRAAEAKLGTNRRFSTSAQAFVKYIDEENKKTIVNLETQRDEALANFDFKLAGLINERINNARAVAQQDFQNALSIIEFSQKNAEKKPEEDATLQLKSDRENSILEALASGSTTVADIFKSVRESVSDITLEEVTGVLESIGTAAGMKDTTNAAEKLTGDAKNFLLMKENYADYLPTSITSLPQEQQLGAYIKWIEGGGSFTTGVAGGGKVGDVFENLTGGTRVARALYGSGRALSDQDMENGQAIYDAGKEAGLTDIEIIKKGLGYNVTRNQPLADNLLNMLLANSEEGLANMDLLGLAQLINNGKDGQAIQKAEDMAYKEAREMAPDSFTSEAAVRIVTRQVNELTTLLEDNGLLAEVGTFQGTITKLATRRLRGEKETEVLNRVENIISEIRKELAGVAVTPTEMAKLEPLFPDIDQPASAFMKELTNLKIIPLLKLNQVRGERSMPRIEEAELFDRSLRVPLYSQAPRLEDDDFFNNPIPTGGAGSTYESSFWDSAP